MCEIGQDYLSRLQFPFLEDRDNNFSLFKSELV